MAKQRYISSDFWVDSYIQELSTMEKLLYIYLFTNSHIDLCGVYEITKKTMCFESGIGIETLSEALERFKKDDKIFHDVGWVCIKNFQKHLKVNPNIQKGIKRSQDLIPTDVLERFETLSKDTTPILIPNGINLDLTEQPTPKPKMDVEENLIFKKLKKWLEGMESTKSPIGLTHFYWKMYPEEIISAALKDSMCTTCSKFGEKCEFLVAQEKKVEKKEKEKTSI